MRTWSSMALVCPADRQKRARASVIGVAGKPTTTTPIFRSSISLANALMREGGKRKRPNHHVDAPTGVGVADNHRVKKRLLKKSKAMTVCFSA